MWLYGSMPYTWFILVLHWFGPSARVRVPKAEGRGPSADSRGTNAGGWEILGQDPERQQLAEAQLLQVTWSHVLEGSGRSQGQ